jgi:pimeloyl-ACP methyl ester carboxylesterase
MTLGFILALPLSRGLAQDLAEPEIVTIIIPAHDGYGDIAMKALLYKPSGKGPFQTVLFSHGRAGKPEERAALKAPINPVHAKFWLDRDIAVLAPIRPGYGITGGEDRENSGVRLNANYECGGAPNVERAATQAAFAVRTALDWLRQQPFVKKNRILLEGQSVGGMTTVVLGGQNPPGVVGFINFAGGTAGFPAQRPTRSCATDQLEALYRKAGQTTRLPNLWLYAVNDQYWGSEAPRLWHKAFAKGGSRTQFVQTGPVENADGHALLSRGQALWSEPVLSFLAHLNF